MITKSQVKYIQSLNDKKFRKEHGVFVAEGTKIINEILVNKDIHPVAIYGTSDWMEQHPALASGAGAESFQQVTSQELERISLLSTPNQVVGIFKQPDFSNDISLKNCLTILLDGIQDPGNLGTIIRIADWFGVPQVIASKDSVDAYNPKVVQSTMGSIARVKVLYEDLADFVLRHSEINLYASVLDGEALSGYEIVKEGMLLIGNESKGISEQLLMLAKHRVTIKRFGKAESLNAAVATGIILSQMAGA